MDTKKATAQPTSRMMTSLPVSVLPSRKNLTSLSPLAPAHDRDGQKEGELGRHRPGQPAQHAAQDGRTAAAGAGDQGQHLPPAHGQGAFVGDAAELGGFGRAGPALDQDKSDAVNDQHQRHHNAVVQVVVHPVVQQDAQHRGGQAGNDDLEPQPHHRPAHMPGRAGVPPVVQAEGPQLVKYSTTTAKIAPSWMTTRNISIKAADSWNFSTCSARIMWPVLETGSHR